MISITDLSLQSNLVTNSLKSVFQATYAKFLLFLKQKSINFSPLPKQITPFSYATSFIMFLPLNGSQNDAFCNIQMKWPASYELLTILVCFKISKIGGRNINQLNNRTRIELISSLSYINQYLKDRQSCLTISYNQFDGFAFQARETIVTTINKGTLKRFITSMLQKALLEFVKYLGQLNEVDFFTVSAKNNKFSNMRQLLETLYISKAKLFINDSKKHQKSIKNCLTFLLANTNQQNSTFQQLKQSNQYIEKYLNFKQNAIKSTQTIGNAIKIHNVKQPFQVKSKRFYQNLQKNKAVAPNSQSITLKNITFQLRKSFGRLRQNKQNGVDYYMPQADEDKTIFSEHVVFKKFIQTNGSMQMPLTQATSNKSKEQMGHINQHNFLMANANLKCPYIGKYYLNINQCSITNVAKRTIMTKMQAGDLFTQVAYNTYHRFTQLQLIEYLTIFQQLAKAVHFLHQNKIIHRDIKPTNVLFKYYSTNNFICKLIDFGSCFIRRQQSRHMFNPKVFTTPRFNLTYKSALKLTKHQISKQFDQDSYESHELFDIYGIAETLFYLLSYSAPKYDLQCLNLIIDICKQPHPNLRFTPQELLILIQHLKLNLIASSFQYLLYNQGSRSFQNN